MRIIGLYSPIKSSDLVKTRERQYRLVRKSKQDIEAIEHKRKLETGRVLTLKSAISAPRSPVNNCGSGSSPDIKNPHDRGLKSPVWGISEPDVFDLRSQYSDWEKSFGEVLEHKKSQRIISTVSLNENQERLIPEFKAFAEKMGLDLPPDSMWSMVMNGMRLSYGDEVIWFENGKVQISS
ncbi:replication endonuclease, partial [Proteus mirabilis]|nr:replication endonuclease [Proteus mirabilis]